MVSWPPTTSPSSTPSHPSSPSFSKVLVLEQRPIVGGAVTTEELYPGFRFSRFSYLCSMFRPKIVQELGLRERGLNFIGRPISSITPTRERGKYLLMNKYPSQLSTSVK